MHANKIVHNFLPRKRIATIKFKVTYMRLVNNMIHSNFVDMQYIMKKLHFIKKSLLNINVDLVIGHRSN